MRRSMKFISRFAPALLIAAGMAAGLGSAADSRSFQMQRAAEAGREPQAEASCFLLYEIGVGEVWRKPGTACQTRVSPQSTFKIPHALAALDAGVLAGPDALFAYDGSAQPYESWRHDQTLRSAIRNSVVWYFQRVAEELGEAREREYLTKFQYGNADPSSKLTSFWLGGSLLISPEEQERFLVHFFSGDLPVSPRAMRIVQQILVQPNGEIVNAAGEHEFGGSWPEGTVVQAKTGSGPDASGKEVRWLVGSVSREKRVWVFVSCVTGSSETPSLAAADLAARLLHEKGVL
jgi:beta-lactamase class D